MSVEWLLIRGSGLVAFVLLGMAVLWGLVISTGVLGRTARPKPVTWFHESLSVGSLMATTVHMVALGVHDFIDFTWFEILVPGVAAWRPMAASLGVVSFYVLALVTVSFYVKPLIGQRAWRSIHSLAFGLYVAALIHGISAGTDSGHPAVIAMYASMTSATLVLLAVRVAQHGQPARARPPGRVRESRPATEPQAAVGQLMP